MSWSLNQGPSFNNVLRPTQKLNGFYQRFDILSNDLRIGKNGRIPNPRKETTKGTFKLKKSKRQPTKRAKPSDGIPQYQPQPIYGGFADVKSKATKKIQKQGGKLKKRQAMK